MTAQTFHFPRYPAQEARRLARDLAGGPRWGRRWLLSLVGGLVLLGSGALVWNVAPREQAGGMMLVGLALLGFSGLAFGIWLWRVVRGPARPWGRLLALGWLATWIGSAVAVQQHQLLTWWPVLNTLGWTCGIGMLLRVVWLARRRPPQADDVGRWIAGATGEDIVVQALAQLGSDHVVIHNLPLVGRGDADHVVVGPAGVVVVETKYLAGRIICHGDGSWTQVKRDEVRQIADPAARWTWAAGGVDGRLRSHGLWNVPVRSVLVLAHPRAELDVARSPVPVVRPFELVPLLRQLAHQRARLDDRTVTEVAHTLLDAGAVSRRAGPPGRGPR